MSSPVLDLAAKLDKELPRKILKQTMGAHAFRCAVAQKLETLPEELRSPLEILQDFSENLDGDIDELLGSLSGSLFMHRYT